jgi:ubiquitin-like domain-containing CTD phosphatase 1
VKPLGVIWGKFPQYSQRNTIMFDDLRRNFLMNPQSGLRIRPFREVSGSFILVSDMKISDLMI